MTESRTTIDRRRLLAASASTTAGAIAGCADIIDSAAEGLGEATKDNEATAAGISEAGAWRLGLPGTNTSEYETERSPEIDGNKYLIFETHKLTTYTANANPAYRMGVLSSPLTRIDGSPSNPVATDNLGAFLGGSHGERFLKAVGVPTPAIGSPTRVSSEHGATMFGNPVTVEEYALDIPSGERGRRETWYAALARVETEDDVVILCCIVDPVFGLADADAKNRVVDLVYDSTQQVTFTPSWSGSKLPDVTVADARLIQILEDSTVQGGADIDDPDVVIGEPSAAMFTIDLGSSPSQQLPAFVGTTVSRYDFDSTPYATQSFDVPQVDLPALFGSGDAPAVFHEATQQGTWTFGSGSNSYPLRLPVFEPKDNLQKIEIDLYTPVGVHVDTGTIPKSDIDMSYMAPLRVGFVELQDPGSTKNTDVDYGDSNGRAINYNISVQSSFEYLERAFPGELVAYRHDVPVVGNIKEDYDSGTDKDASEARAALNRVRQRSRFPNNGTILTTGPSQQEARQLLDPDSGGAFDVTVMILPRKHASGNQNYFAAHGMGKFVGYWWGNKKAVGSLELKQGGDNMGHISTTAQEIGHYFGQSLYSGARARTKDNGNTDQLHASGNIETVGYDMTDGTYRLVTNPGATNGTFDVNAPKKDRNQNPVTSSYTSYMSYTGGDHWGDGLIHQEIINARFTVPNVADTPERHDASQRVGDADPVKGFVDELVDVQPVIEAYGAPREDGIDFHSSYVYDTEPVDADGGSYDPDRHDDATPVDVELRDPVGETLVSVTVPDRVHGSQDDRPFQSVAASLPFPRTAISLVATREDVDTTLNPIVQPLRDAVAEIPPRGTNNDPANRTALTQALDDVETRMDEGSYEEAAAVLDESFRGAIDDGVVEYESFANQPRSEDLQRLTDRMVERLHGLGDQPPEPSTTFALEGPAGSTICVEPVEADRSVAEYYGYDREPSDSSSTPDGLEREDAIVTFLYRNTATGDLSLVCLNGDATASSDGGGRAPMTFTGVSGTEWLVQDGQPGDGFGDQDPYETAEGPLGESESVIWGWDDSKTDGGAIGPLGESFDVGVVSDAEATVQDVTAAREGLDSWLFVDGGDIEEPIEIEAFTEETGDVSIRISSEGCE